MAQRPRRKPDYDLEVIDDELLLFHPTRAQILYCNETASLIWQLCDGERSSEDIVALLVAAFPQTAEAIAADVVSTLQLFAQHGAIEWV